MPENTAVLETANSADYIENVVSFNVKMRLSALGKTQGELGNALGVKNTTVSMKLSGHTAWSLADLVRAANFLETTPVALMDDSIMKAMGVTANKKCPPRDSNPEPTT